MQRYNIEGKNLSFKNLLSGPAPVNRVFNYLKYAYEGNLYDNGIRSTTDNYDSWCIKWMIGLELVTNSENNDNKINLSDTGRQIVECLINKNIDTHDESITSYNKLIALRAKISLEAPELLVLLTKVFQKTFIYKILCDYISEKGNNFSTNSFKADFFETVKQLYTNTQRPSNPSSGGTTTGDNRVPSLIQLCEFLGLLYEINNKYVFIVNKLDTIEETPSLSNAEQKAQNIILYGVPGSGKSYTIATQYCNNNEYISRIVFHPEYSNSDFVGQILPVINENGTLKYEFRPGPFTKILERAIHDKPNLYYLIIEELNRGNAPGIFGDIFQLLDRNKNGESTYGITNKDIAKYIYNNENVLIKIPSNLYIIATMNTADQNVFTLDTAFQRRWKMQYIYNKFEGEQAEKKICNTDITWKAFALTINKKLMESSTELLTSEDKRLGLYFITDEEFSKKYFAQKVLKYLWDDAFKMNRTNIFNNNILSFEDLPEIYNNSGLENVLNESTYADILNFSNSNED